MQLDANLVVKLLDDRLLFVGTIGYIPVPERIPANQRNDISSLISREHYLAFRFSKEWGVYAGLMDLAFGIRIPDHTAYSRAKAYVSQNDQVHGVMVHTAQKNWEAAIHGVVGNLAQSADLRLRGVSATGEIDVFKSTRIGLSGMALNNSYRQRKLASIHARTGFAEGNSLLAETGFISDAPVSSDSTLSHYIFLQSMTRMVRGLHLLLTTEYFANKTFGDSVRYFRFGPAVQYFPMQRLELRLDLQGTRLTGQSTVNSDSFSLLSQVHIWL
jgi:hypothetical protein